MGSPTRHGDTTDKTNIKGSRKQSPVANRNSTTSSQGDVDAFLTTLKDLPATVASRYSGRLIFALDATASRQPTWDRATSMQNDMFVKTRGIGALDIQLVYYRGYRECRASKWVNQPEKLLGLMKKVSCEAGRTQIERILKHALSETRSKPVQAVVFVGDCVEEDIDVLGNLAGKLRINDLPVFIFQEGFDANASYAFSQIAKISGGAHCRFDDSSAAQLGELLNAVAIYAAGGKKALRKLSQQGSVQATVMLEQLEF